ncbi:hypothetical protein GCM10025857_34730 [Alicyclobacillus contaminans]|uniref:YqeG family HAD IIIA-type phosphatase n=1 Tax=Alicyclobacillus contaminans TaxID=392016 RepID=UPI0004037C4A|nr:YqeG family HAD IIIA-type phosphatase [Alicyclobacillus contaminans]GMA52116.1 hypothetical protein GCM10025857_34730 [Alicyclobacillus contaminans]
MHWLERLWPDEYVADIQQIDLDKLRANGYRLILTDLDNTLVPWNHPELPDALVDWLRAVRQRGFSVCILSNNAGPRVNAFAAKAGVDYIAAARKPKQEAFRRALAQFGVPPEAAVMVGDQLFTDIQGGNRCGLYTILVLPIAEREWWGTRLVRRLERIVLRRLVRKGLVIPQRKVKGNE